MTNKQRAQVVELLRCAADNDGQMGVGLIGMFNPPTESPEIARLAWKALLSFTWPEQDWTDDDVDGGYRHALLEAALRVEQGELL